VDPAKHGIEAARKRIAQKGLGERVSAENIGGHEIGYSREFDLAMMVVSLHEIRPEIREKAVRKAHQALKAGGQIVILDFPNPAKMEDFRYPMYDMTIQEQFFEICPGFVHRNTNERNEMLERVGFKDLDRMAIGKGIFELVTATE
jgi:SAM-dependent methyltransferase